ncbi:MAG: response regulator transcription factor [Maioricimonas sp. JB049]
MASAKKILLIEDDREISSTLSGVLDCAGYSVITAPNGIEGQRLIQSEEPDLVITDMMMPRMGGFPVLEFIRTLDQPPAVIMITANEGGRHKAYAEMLGVVEYLRKPFAMELLLDAVSRAFEKRSGKATKSTASKSEKGPLRRTRTTRKKAT